MTVRNALAHNLNTNIRGKRRIVSNPAVLGGEPVFEGTRIPIAHVAGLVTKRVPLSEIAEDYPALTPAAIAFAAIHAKMKRNPGRPKAPLRLRRKNGQAAGTGTRSRKS
jgi:uncharacterized protein (DUF433 family)